MNGIGILNKCDSEQLCQEFADRRYQGLACQGLYDFPGRHCCITNDYPLNNHGKCCNIDCKIALGELLCSGIHRVRKHKHPGLGLRNKCVRDEQCIGVLKDKV